MKIPRNCNDEVRNVDEFHSESLSGLITTAMHKVCTWNGSLWR